MTLTETDSEQNEYRCLGHKFEGQKGVRVRTIAPVDLCFPHTLQKTIHCHVHVVAVLLNWASYTRPPFHPDLGPEST